MLQVAHSQNRNGLWAYFQQCLMARWTKTLLLTLSFVSASSTLRQVALPCYLNVKMYMYYCVLPFVISSFVTLCTLFTSCSVCYHCSCFFTTDIAQFQRYSILHIPQMISILYMCYFTDLNLGWKHYEVLSEEFYTAEMSLLHWIES